MVYAEIDRIRAEQKNSTQKISSIISEFSRDKQKLKDDNFTFGELCSYLYNKSPSEEELKCLKKLVKIIKREYIDLKGFTEIEEEQFPNQTKI